MSAHERAVLAKLFLADRTPGGDGFARFFAALEPAEATHPIARWIERKRAALDWDENVCDMVSRYFGLPPKPLGPGERDNGYAAAAARLEQALTREGWRA